MTQMDKQKVIRKDGIEFERKRKQTKYDTNITIRCSKDTLERLKQLAKEVDKNYSDIIRELIEQYIEYLNKKGK